MLIVIFTILMKGADMDIDPTSNESDFPESTPLVPSIETEPSTDPINLPDTPFVNVPRPELVLQPISEMVQPQPEAEKPESEPEKSYVSHRPDAHQFRASQPVLETKEHEKKDVTASGPGLIVLQWLTYTFWGWTVLAMSILVIIVLTFFLDKSLSVGDSPLYSMAAVLVLLPIAAICDFLYIKREPLQKTGAASAVTIVHAVIFALFAIGALISVVFSLVTLMISASGSETTNIYLYGGLIIAVLYALVFLRTILPKFLVKFRTAFVILMVVIVGTICAFSIFGPVNEAKLTRNDKLIVANLSTVNEAITSYTNTNSKLPTDLNSLKLTGDAKKLVTDKLVIYQKDSAPYSAGSDYPTYYYQLCVNYTKADTTQSSYSSGSIYDSGDGYSSYLTTYGHGAGNTCYKLKTIDYGSGYPTPVPMTNATK